MCKRQSSPKYRQTFYCDVGLSLIDGIKCFIQKSLHRLPCQNLLDLCHGQAAHTCSHLKNCSKLRHLSQRAHALWMHVSCAGGTQANKGRKGV